MKLKLLLFYISFFLITACKKFQSSPEAFFLQVGDINLNTTSKEGSGQHKITDLWVYVNGKFSGCYPTENQIPILSHGKKVSINVFAGIKNNGIPETRTPWPFYDRIDFDTLIATNQKIKRNFTFKYNTTTTFKWIENFDNQGQSLIKSTNSKDTTVSLKLVSNNLSLEGKYLELSIQPGGNYAQIETYNSFELPFSNSNVYLELNYQCNNPFSIAIIGDNTQIKEVYTFNTQNNWNKTYIQLANVVNFEPVSKAYKICFYMAKTDNDLPRVLLDNLKLVYL